MNYYDLALKRKSTREFKPRKVGSDLLEEINDYALTCPRLLKDAQTKWQILLGENTFEALSGCAGYHGFMVEAPAYLLLLSDPCPWYLENAGYMGEEMVLKLTDLGLATCWITIREPEKLKEKLNLATPMVPAALIAFGWEKTSPGMRIDIKSPSNISLKQRSGQIAPKLYLEDAVYEADWGMPSTIQHWSPRSDLYRALIAACCAPTTLNRQPFRFIFDHNQITLVILPDQLTSPENAKLNTGIVMHDFAKVMEQQNSRAGQWNLTPADNGYHLPKGAVAAGSFSL